MAIHINPAHKGELRRKLHVPDGQKIPANALQKAAHSKNSHTRAQAVFALNARHFKHAK